MALLQLLLGGTGQALLCTGHQGVGRVGVAGLVLVELVQGLVKVPVPLEAELGAEEASLDVELDTGWTLELGWLATAWGLARGGQLLFELGGSHDRHVHLGDLRLAGSLVIVGPGVLRLAGGPIHVNVGLGGRLGGLEGDLRLARGHANVVLGVLRLAGSYVSRGGKNIFLSVNSAL